VDEPEQLKSLVDQIVRSSDGMPLIFPAHPRTAKILSATGLTATNLHVIEPLGYLEFNYLVRSSKAVITDSGGITEETTVMGIPCITLRDNTERPETITTGTNELIGTDPKNIHPAMRKLFSGQWKKGAIPKLWDGKTAERIVNNIVEIFGLDNG
jgi:UDP-N-acetylglucosamine 2-epimerase (non-hydrolysing)